jgi:hypothetical protein
MSAMPIGKTNNGNQFFMMFHFNELAVKKVFQTIDIFKFLYLVLSANSYFFLFLEKNKTKKG